ncbi:DsbA family protein [Paenibacillus xanthanilyticus]|uniref:DsbA family protein n=1 Tax=Paenibacillus xanthanilyticus TaxID=1783531 RepID=A0ABV8K0V9_9BACL
MQKATAKAAHKANYKAIRQHEAQKKKQRMRWIMGLTAVVFVGLIALAIAFKPSDIVDFDYEALPLSGQADAPVKIVEFGDYKCPVCQTFSQTIVPQIEKDFVDSGDVGLYFANFQFIGPDSFTAAYAAQSVYHQNKDEFWKYYDLIYKNQGPETEQWATVDFLVKLAQDNNIAVDYDTLRSDIENATYADEVEDHNGLARSSKVTGTPSIFINGEKFDNVMDYGAIKSAIEKALSEAKAAKDAA